ncbi:MAG: polysaccharide deacetylase family protein [Nanoarchaeota archaeon]
MSTPEFYKLICNLQSKSPFKEWWNSERFKHVLIFVIGAIQFFKCIIFLKHFNKANFMPNGKVIIYWDYELQIGADVSQIGYKDGIEDYIQTEFILKFLKKADIKTCFAVVGKAAERGELPYHAPEQIRQMIEEGHEVGSHTYSHRKISRLTYEELREELVKSKEAIEKITRKSCTAFVPPWDKPQYFGNLAWDFSNQRILPKLSGLSLQQICQELKEIGYRTYRICPLLSRFTQLKLSHPFLKEEVLCLPCRLKNGFGIEAKKLVKKAIEKKGLAVVYGHPGGLAREGEQSKVNFIDFIHYLAKERENNRLEIITPKELLLEKY